MQSWNIIKETVLRLRDYMPRVSPATTIRTVSSMLSLHKYINGFLPLIDSTAEVVY